MGIDVISVLIDFMGKNMHEIFQNKYTKFFVIISIIRYIVIDIDNNLFNII